MLFILPVLILFILFVFILPHSVRFLSVRRELLPVSVTSLGLAAPQLEYSPLALPPEEDTYETLYDGLDDFAATIVNGQAGQVVGVWAPGLFALPVRQQPAGQPDFVASENNMLTEFALPKKYGSTGLLAHNYLSGSRFSALQLNQEVLLVYGNGRIVHYRISRVASFQALKPNSPFSNFVDVSDSYGSILSSAELFNQVYTTRQQLVFQTCIEANGEPSWGRLFIFADLVEPLNLTVPSLGSIPTVN